MGTAGRYSFDERFAVFRECLDRSYGRPAQSVAVDQTSNTDTQITYNIRWLPPDPNDHSRVIMPEPDDPALVEAAKRKP
jgi:hypothetical protein